MWKELNSSKTLRHITIESTSTSFSNSLWKSRSLFCDSILAVLKTTRVCLLVLLSDWHMVSSGTVSVSLSILTCDTHIFMHKCRNTFVGRHWTGLLVPSWWIPKWSTCTFRHHSCTYIFADFEGPKCMILLTFFYDWHPLQMELLK